MFISSFLAMYKLQKMLKATYTSFSLHSFSALSSTRRSPLTVFHIARAISLTLLALLVANGSLWSHRSAWARGILPRKQRLKGSQWHWAPKSSTRPHKISGYIYILHWMPIPYILKVLFLASWEFSGVRRKEELVNGFRKHTPVHSLVSAWVS